MTGSKLPLVALGAVALAGLSGIACAGVVNATFNGVGPAVSLNYTLVAPPGGGGTSAGLFNWTVNSNTGLPLGPTFTGFCIELTQNVSPNSAYTYTETVLDQAPDPDQAPFSPMGVLKAAQIARLMTVFNADITGTAAERAAAAQVAIWETVYDDSVTTTAGNFSIANVAISAKADSYLTAQVLAAPTMGLYALTSDTAQDMLVPAPGAAALLGLGLVTIGRRRRS